MRVLIRSRYVRQCVSILFSYILPTLWVSLLGGISAYGNSLPQAVGQTRPDAGPPKGEPSPSPQSLIITPVSIIIQMGEPQVLRLFDDQKRPIRDAVWSVSDPSKVEIKGEGSVATVNGLSRGKITVTATWKGLTAQARVTVIGDSTQAGGAGESKSDWLRMTPNKVTMLAGEERPLRLVDENGKQIADADWNVSNPELAQITPGSDATFRALAPGKLTVTALWQGRTTEGEINIFTGPDLPQGTVKWSVKELPGFSTKKIIPAVPSASGPDIYVTEEDGCGRSIVRALTSDGLELWRKLLSAGRGARQAGNNPGSSAEDDCASPHPKFDTPTPTPR